MKTGLTTWVCLVLAWGSATFPALGQEPKLRMIDPSSGFGGQKIKLLGDNLAKTSSVHFLIEHNVRTATFRVVSNNQLEVTVPEVLHNSAAALILLEHAEGILVTCPVNEIVVNDIQSAASPSGTKSPLLHVIRGGAIHSSSTVAVVEEGGIINHLGSQCPLAFIKRGGIVGRVESHSSHPCGPIYCEAGAKLGPENPQGKHPRKIITVKAIHLAEGIGPFVFQTAPIAAGLDQPKSIPEIHSISPAVVPRGGIMNVKGKGFSGTSRVYVLPNQSPVTFQIVSDTELKVETHDSGSGHAELVVINARGMALTQCTVNRSTNTQRGGLTHVTDGKILASRDSGMETVCFIERGGIVTADGGVVAVKNGGTITTQPGLLFHEPEATIPARRRSPSPQSIEVAEIHLNRLNQGLEIGPRHLQK